MTENISPEDLGLKEVDDTFRNAKAFRDALMEKYNRGKFGEKVVPPGPSLFQRFTKGLSRAAEEGTAKTVEDITGGVKEVTESAPEIFTQETQRTGAVDYSALGRTALGALRAAAAVPAGMARIIQRAPVTVTEEVFGLQPSPLAAKISQWGEIPTGAALPILPGAAALKTLMPSSTVLSKLRIVPKSWTGATEEAKAAAGPLADAAKADEFARTIFDSSAGEAVRDGLLEKATGGGYKMTGKGMRVAREAAATPTEKALPSVGETTTVTPGPRTIEVPPTEDRLTRRIRERLREEQAASTGEYAPEGPSAVLRREEPLRGAGGQIIRPARDRFVGEERVPTVEEASSGGIGAPRDFKAGPSGKERAERAAGTPEPPPRQRDIPPPEDPRATLLAKEPDEVRAGAPRTLLEESTKGDPLPDPDSIFARTKERVGREFQSLKARAGVSSMTDIARGDTAFEELVQKTKDANRFAKSLADKWIDQRDAIRKALGSDEEFSNALRTRDAGQPFTGDPEVGRMIDEMYNDIATNLGIPPGHPLFEEGYVRRLRQKVKVVESRMTEVPAYTSADITRIVPSRVKAGYLKERKLQTPGIEESYTPEAVGAYIRSAARSSALGTDMKPGYLQEITPLLEELSNRPDIIKRTVTDYVNWYIGTEGSRSVQSSTEWANRLRSYQFIRTIGGNTLSPIWNTTQRVLTAAETSPTSFAKAIGDEIKFYFKDPDTMALLDRAGISHEMASAGTASDVADIPADILNKTDQLLQKWAQGSGWLFRKTERGNRVHAFFAGYRDGIEKGLDETEAIRYGKKIMDKTQFTGGEADLPPRYRSATGSVVGQYKTFQTKYAEYMKNNFADMFKEGPGRLEAVKKFGKFWSANIALGGPTTLPFIGDWLEEQVGQLPLDAQKGLGGLLGISLAHQVGSGVLPIDSAKNFMFSLPGPTLSSAQDAASLAYGLMTGTYKSFGDAADLSNIGKDLTPDEVARRYTRLAPTGSQLNRFRRSVQAMWTGGVVKAPMNMLQAFGAEPATGAKMAEVTVNPVSEAFGFQTTARDREYEIRAKQAEDDRIKHQAVRDASLLAVQGLPGADDILTKAEKRLGLEIGKSLKITPESRRAASESLRLSPLEKVRQRKAKRGEAVPSPYGDVID